MRNKTKVINNFILESMITFLPLCITYLLVGMWLSSNVTDFGRAFSVPEGASFIEAYGSKIEYVWFEFDSVGPNHASYDFEIVKVFWYIFILLIVLTIIGKLLALVLKKVIAK